ncbi:serine--tRNA ligase [Candidatus Wirthbacteria bacterium CG2_30_54_11]|uniref:Serine--tRNA ligase n=1 Tax=Candidatus Wirthbacteria bacterium CG2_30_54_11 TaxID=1817892 RepID=A0A1J5IHQ4_9BACT|nr:MAG: serine--tRNA ligase [Candidatus Wirthbacteria bacterium CG2_30_54_11]
MLDLSYLRKNQAGVKALVKRRNMNVDIDRLIEVDRERRRLISASDELRAQRNQLSDLIPKLQGEKRAESIAQVQEIKAKLSAADAELSPLESEFNDLYLKVPNLLDPAVPVGKDDSDNVEIRSWGTPPVFDFQPLDHVELGERAGLIDFEKAVQVAGAKFYFLMRDAVRLEYSLIWYALGLLEKDGYVPIKAPVLAKKEILQGTGYNPRGEETQIYSIADTDLGMIATSEISIAGYLAGEMLEEKALPLRYAGISECYRTEAGNYGRFSKGLYRVHHFDKVEMFAFTKPDESELIHQSMVAMEEKIFQGLKIPYRVVDICDGDMGGVAYRKYDLEGWMPGRGDNGSYGEITSCSNCTDYQARRLNIRYRPANGAAEYVHTLNGTAIAISRALIVILENYQRADGSIEIPDVLKAFMGKEIIEPTRKN